MSFGTRKDEVFLQPLLEPFDKSRYWYRWFGERRNACIPVELKVSVVGKENPEN